MKIKRGSLLTVLLAMLCAALIALGVGFVLPKNEIKSARAAGGELIKSDGSKYDDDALDALASAANYDDINKMLDALDGGTILKSSNFGSYTVTFGGKAWWPVYAKDSTLTLWLVNSIGNYTFSDGSRSTINVAPASNNYATSWLRAAINAGQITPNTYNGDYNASTGASNVYYTNQKSSSANSAPTACTVLEDFAKGGQYANFIASGECGDNLWLPSTSEAQNGGTWGCTTAQWVINGNTNQWLRTPNPSNSNEADTLLYYGSSTGGSVYTGVEFARAVRPCINLKLKSARRLDAPKDVEATYNGSTLSIADVATNKEWYDASLMDLTYPTANATDMIDVGTYTVKVELNATAITDGYLFRGDANPGKGDGDESDTIRYFNFKINPQPIPVPTITNSPQIYNPVNGSSFTVSSTFDAATMNAVAVSTTGITWNAASNCFDATAVGTYSVKFVLKDKVNYVWNKGANGTTDDQQTTVKVEPIKLTVPTITAPQEYTGSALQFVLADFNSGADIKVDSATGTGSSTVTGASGAAITDTTDTFEAVPVGKYTVKLSLRDSTNYAWKDGTNGAKNVDFEITQKELISTAIASDKTNKTGGAEWEFGDTATITITDDRASSDNINLLCYYDKAGGTSKSNTLTINTVGNVSTITMPTNIAVGNYTLTVELNGSTGDNANYVITKNNTLNFKVTSGKLDPSTYGWTYTKDGAAGGTISDGDKLPFELKAGSSVDGVKYELSIQIPTTDTFVIVDASKYTAGYLTRSGDSVNTFKTVVALKSTDTNNLFEVNGNKQDTCEVELNWEIEKGTFDLSGVKWEYSLNGTSGWTEYNPAKPPQYNDGYDITVRVKASTLPLGLTLDSNYTGTKESAVSSTYTATISASDLKYNTNNFNAPNTSLLTLNWEIAKKNLFNGFKNVAEPFALNSNGYSGTIIIKQLDLDPTFAGYIDYVYYDLDNGGTIVTLQDIKDAVDLTNPHNYKVEANIKTAYAANYTVDDNGSTPSDQFKTGSNNKLADAAIDNATAVYDGNTHFDVSHVTVTGSDSMNVTDFTVKYYKGTTPVAANELPAGELPKDAGDYCIEVILGTMAESKYILVTDRLIVKIEALGIDIPTLGAMTFNGNEQKFEDYISGASWTTYGPAGMNIIKVDGKISDRNVGANNYTTTLEITDTNYKWINPSTVAPTKAVVKYSLAADEVKPTVNGDCTVATYNWNIKPLIVDTTKMWNKGKKGATLNLPQNIKDLIAGGTLEVGYRYYEDGQFVAEPEIKSGKSFTVEAVFAGDDSVRNVQFKRSDTDFGATSKSIDYTVPKSGAAVFFGKVKDFMTSTAAGLPVWAWLLISLVLLILLIVIIVVCVKRRKTKEEREEKKALKEEERMRREEERRLQQERLEEERRLQREKLEAERELARAKQEAELEKIRAQAQAGMAGAGMATMAMAQQQPQQQIPVQTVDNDFLKEMREQMAELRADNKATQAKLAEMQHSQQAPMAQPMMPMQQYPMYQQPMQMPMMPQYGDPTLARLEAQLNAMQAEQRARYDAEQRIELAAMRAEQHVDRDSRHSVDLAAMREHINGHNYNRIPDYSNAPANQQPNSIEALGAIVAAALKNMANGETAATQPVPELPQKAEQEPVAKYPSDAVITTTTTVDTTKSKPITRSRDEEENFDVDGFYDTFE